MNIHPNELAAKGSDKIKLYGWTVKDVPGKLEWLNKRVLDVDPSYQRDAKDHDPKVKRIAGAWSWAACGALIVGHRAGHYYVIDGQHRVRAAMKRSDIQELPCVVFETDGPVQEAGAFLSANRERKPMTAHQAFNAMVVANDPAALFLQGLLAEYGLVVRNHHGDSSFQAPGQMLKLANEDQALARRVFSVAAELCLPGNIHSDLIRGLAYIERRLTDRSITDKDLRSRILKVGRDALLKQVVAAKAFRGVGGDKVIAEGILAAVNHGLRSKKVIIE